MNSHVCAVPITVTQYVCVSIYSNNSRTIQQTITEWSESWQTAELLKFSLELHKHKKQYVM
jgi:hypothetical protein